MTSTLQVGSPVWVRLGDEVIPATLLGRSPYEAYGLKWVVEDASRNTFHVPEVYEEQQE